MMPLGRMVQVRTKKRKLVSCGSRLEQQSIRVDNVISNEYLITEILLRVPPKALLSFMFVSKQWFSIISDPKFCSRHAHRNTKSSLVSGLNINMTVMPERKICRAIPVFGSYRNLPTLYCHELGRTLSVSDSCNGLMLCSGGNLDLVCNLTTKKYKLLSELDGNSFKCLEFDPSKSPHYMVITVAWRNYSYDIRIYSSENSSWKTMVVPSTKQHGRPVHRIVFWNGSAYWITYGNFLFQFNVDTEELIVTPKLGLSRDHFNLGILYFGKCGGRLLLVHHVESPEREFQIREMGSNNSNSWTVWCKFNFTSLVNKLARRRHHLDVLTIVKGELDDDFSLGVM